METLPRRYRVLWDDQLVLEITDRPGPLISRPAPPPRPGEPPVEHPFLSAVAYVPEHEGRLREVLDRSENLQAFLEALRELGYVVLEED